MGNPLDIFFTWVYFPINPFGLQVAIDRTILTIIGLCISWGIVVILFVCMSALVPLVFSRFILNIYEFCVKMINDQAGKYGAFFVPCLLTVGFGIFMGNSHGLLPFANTITAHFVMTGFLALCLNLGFFIMGIKRHGLLPFLKTFFPRGIKGPLAYLVFIIEFMSYLMRTLSLGVRLFANMLAGHLLLHILATFSIQWNMFFGVILTSFIVILVIILEIAIAIIQTYVFSILSAIYLRDPLVRL